MCTFDVGSKESWMKREMIDVFPTFWSPTNVTLNLFILLIDSITFLLSFRVFIILQCVYNLAWFLVLCFFVLKLKI